MTVERSTQTRVFYESGVSMQCAYPTFAAPTARLDFTRNPTFGLATEKRSLPQASADKPAGDIEVSAVASVATRDYPYQWQAMPEGFPQLQRISDTGILQATTAASDDLTSAEALVSFGFRSFDGAEPTSITVQELNAIDGVEAEHAFTFGTRDLVAHPQGLLRRIESTVTTGASTKKLRLRAQSGGQDFGVTDGHAQDAAGTDFFESLDWHLDSDQDGVADAWAIVSGASFDHFAEDAAGLIEWIELISQGGLRTFQMKRPGGGEIVTVRVRSPVRDIGWSRLGPGTVGPVEVRLVRPAS